MFRLHSRLQLGIQVDLQDETAWRALAAFIMWITIVQVHASSHVCVCMPLCDDRGVQHSALLHTSVLASGLTIGLLSAWDLSL